jgi:cytochrome c553
MKADRLYRFNRERLIVALALGAIAAVALVMPGGGDRFPTPEPAVAQDCGPAPNQAELRGLLADLMRAWVPLRNEPSALPEPASRGAKLLSTHCAQCHGLPDPKTYSGSEWPRVLDRMALRATAIGSRRCKLLKLTVPTAEEHKTILDYLKRHAFEPLNAGPSVPLEGKGGMAFLTFCSQCHDLPHPRQHLVSEWPKVVDRMQDYAYFVGRRMITDAEKEAITEFLKSKGR